MDDNDKDFGYPTPEEPTSSDNQPAAASEPLTPDHGPHIAWAVPMGGVPERNNEPLSTPDPGTSWAPPPSAPTGERDDEAPTWPGSTLPSSPPDSGSWPPVTPTAVVASVDPPRYGTAPPDGGAIPAQSSRRGPGGPTGPAGWIAVALVAALIGGGVGAGVVALANHNDTGSTVTIKEGNGTPGAAVLNGNVSIPSLVQKVLPAVVSIDVKAGQEEDQGTGMIVTSGGLVITNNHVISLATGRSAGTITVTESGTTKAQAAKLVGTDPNNDVALLQVTGASNLPTITFGDSDKVVVGDAVVAIGNALGLAAGTPTVTQGIISALNRTVTAGDSSGGSATETLTNLMQTDAAINPGNSGGPLIDSAGEVIGMNTAVAGSTSDGSSAQNIGFAIPSNKIQSLIPELQAGGVAANGGGYLGVDVATLTPALRQQYNFTPTTGAVILDVVPGSPADTAGLAQGDVIVAINSTSIATSSDLQSAIASFTSGQTVTVHYYTGTQAKSVQVKLGSGSTSAG